MASKIRRRRGTGKNSVTLKVDMGSVRALIADLEDDIHKAVRPAAHAATEVLYQAVLTNVDAIGRVTGNLRSAIYQVFSESQSKEAGGGYSKATYHVSWNAKKAPHGHLVEYGHLQKYRAYIGRDGKWYTDKRHPLPAPKQVAARPFIRPAFARQADAAAAAEARLLELVGAK